VNVKIQSAFPDNLSKFPRFMHVSPAFQCPVPETTPVATVSEPASGLEK